MSDTTSKPPPTPAAGSPAPPRKRKGWAMTLLKIVIAVAGIWFVLHKVTWEDSATLKATGETPLRNVTITEPVEVQVLRVEEGAVPATTAATTTTTRPREAMVTIRFGKQKVHMVVDGEELYAAVDEDLRTKSGRLGLPNELTVPESRLEKTNGEAVRQGLHKLVVRASGRWPLLLLAWAIMGIPFFVTAIRWRNLMRPQGIDMPLGKCLQLTFVGQFYSIMLPGITGGDLVKIVYAARLTGSKTKSFVTIILDRVIGLVALMVIAGLSAGVQLLLNARSGGGVADKTLLNVFLFICGILGMMAVGSLLYFSRRLRRLSGLEKLLKHPKVPSFIQHADNVLHAYRGHFGLLGWAFFISLLSQLALPLSAWLSGTALGMTAPPTHYMAYVPMAILAASLPISPPQGIGFLDWVLNHFFVSRGAATSSQAIALAQAIRFLPLMWNIVGIYWVITGKYSRHKAEEEEKSLKDD